MAARQSARGGCSPSRCVPIVRHLVRRECRRKVDDQVVLFDRDQTRFRHEWALARVLPSAAITGARLEFLPFFLGKYALLPAHDPIKQRTSTGELRPLLASSRNETSMRRTDHELPIPDMLTSERHPIRWQSRARLYRQFETHMRDSGVRLTVVECAYGGRSDEFAGNPHVMPVPVCAQPAVDQGEPAEYRARQAAAGLALCGLDRCGCDIPQIRLGERSCSRAATIRRRASLAGLRRPGSA